jgi:integrase/recombinase XerD
LEAVAGLRNRVALATAYATGLRIGEVCRLKVASIHSKRMLIHVEGGKGAKDRYAMLSPRLLDVLREYWNRAHPGLWLFPGREPGGHIGVAARQGGRLGAMPRNKKPAFEAGSRQTSHGCTGGGSGAGITVGAVTGDTSWV